MNDPDSWGAQPARCEGNLQSPSLRQQRQCFNRRRLAGSSDLDVSRTTRGPFRRVQYGPRDTVGECAEHQVDLVLETTP